MNPPSIGYKQYTHFHAELPVAAEADLISEVQRASKGMAAAGSHCRWRVRDGVLHVDGQEEGMDLAEALVKKVIGRTIFGGNIVLEWSNAEEKQTWNLKYTRRRSESPRRQASSAK